MAELDGQTAIVTGAGSGIGRATAELLAQMGAHVVLTDIAGHGEAAGAIAATDLSAEAADLDVRDPEAWAAVVADLLDARGRIDILVNNAGIVGPRDTVVDAEVDLWDRIMGVNARGVWLGMKHVLPAMREAGRGKIVNVASTAAHIGLRDSAAYCASKGAVLALTRQAGVQYASENIQINSVSPGTTMTAIQNGVTDAMREVFRGLTPIGRFAESPEVARAIVFLCTEGSSFITATDLSVDGGMVAF